MRDLAGHIIETKAADFDPAKFEDRYENAVVELIRSKQAGQPVKAPEAPRPSNVVNLMDALCAAASMRRSRPAAQEGAIEGERRARCRAAPSAQQARAAKKGALRRAQGRECAARWRAGDVNVARRSGRGKPQRTGSPARPRKAQAARALPQAYKAKRDFAADARSRRARPRRADGRPLLRPEARRPPSALRPAARARRRSEELGGDARPEPRSRREAPRRPHRGPSARVPHLRGRDPEGRVRRRDHDRLGPGPLDARWRDPHKGYAKGHLDFELDGRAPEGPLASRAHAPEARARRRSNGCSSRATTSIARAAGRRRDHRGGDDLGALGPDQRRISPASGEVRSDHAGRADDAEAAHEAPRLRSARVAGAQKGPAARSSWSRALPTLADKAPDAATSGSTRSSSTATACRPASTARRSSC